MHSAYKSKTLATWVALLAGVWGLHRFYLYGLRDVWGWLCPIPTALGIWGVRRALDLGQDDQLSWLLIPLLGLMVAATLLQAIVIGLTPDAQWHRRFNPDLADHPLAPTSGWPVIVAVVVSLLVGAGVLMATIAFSGQRYFEYQVDEARKLSQ